MTDTTKQPGQKTTGAIDSMTSRTQDWEAKTSPAPGSALVGSASQVNHVLATVARYRAQQQRALRH
jgi:hypothetical protein